MLTVVVKAAVKGWAALAQEAECKGVWHTGVGVGEGGVVQQSCEVGRGRGRHEGEAWVWGAACGGGV